MAEQFDLAVLFGSEPPRHALRCGVLAIDAMDHPLDLERGESPVDRRARRLDGVTLALGFPGDAPADLEIRPGRRKPRPDPADEFSAAPFLDREHAGAVQRPVSGHDDSMSPAGHLVDHGIAVDGDEPRGRGIGQHRGVWRDIGAAPLPQPQTRGLDHGTVRLRKCDAWLEGSNHRRFHFHGTVSAT